MSEYEQILIIHAIDNSTLFLNRFEEEFQEYYFSFDSTKESILKAKNKIGDLTPKSLIIYLGHGSSYGLYEPNNENVYEELFLDVKWGNHFFEKHDIFLLSCKSNEYLSKIYDANLSLGFGNIISSEYELKLHNEKSQVKKCLNLDEINLFNNIYLDSSIKIVRYLINKKISFIDIPKYFRFILNMEINKVLLNKEYKNRVELSRILFEFRSEMTLLKNA